ncbi:MAG: carboxymuconolactone decarboxylase family protein [Proteobacteria bacterium]|nr:carboxymuconolactone decarboxylase family protein [Pseudomonadota bacterium]
MVVRARLRARAQGLPGPAARTHRRGLRREPRRSPARTRRLIKLALSVGARSEGAVHSHARQAVNEGMTSEELRQVAALAITTLGFPAAMAGLSWINDMLKGEG